MTDIGFLTPQQARETWDTIKLLRSSGLLRNLSSFSRPDDPGIHPVWVKNTSGEEIPPFACMQVDGTEVVGELTYVLVKKPDAIDSQYLFNHDTAIEIDGYGMSLPWGVVRMIGSSTAPNEQFGATIGDWGVQIQDGGPFVVFGPDNTRDGIVKGRIAATGGGGTGSQVIEFTILDPSSASSTATASSSVDEELCANQVYDAPSSIMANVTRRPCGVTTVYGEDDAGNVEVHDRLESFLCERSLADVVGKKGIAVLMSANADEPASASSGSSSAEIPCEWVIIWIDWFRWIRVQTNTIVGSDRITFSYRNVKVWDDCKLADEVVIGTDCDEASSTSSAV